MIEPSGLEPVTDIASVFVALHESRGAQRVEVLGHRLAAHRKLSGQLGGGDRTLATDQRQDFSAGGIGQRLEHGARLLHTRTAARVRQSSSRSRSRSSQLAPMGRRRTPPADIYSRLLKDRIVFFGSVLDDTVANVVTAQLLHLEAEDPSREIQLYINSPGGDMTGLFAIYDTMQYIHCPISTICVGQAASAAAVLLAAGSTGCERVARDIERDHIMRGEDAVAYGMIDHVITRRELHPVVAVSA